MVNNYRVFGINLASEIELPELLPIDFPQADVCLKIGEVPKQLQNPAKIRKSFEVSCDQVLIRAKNVGRFLIERGKRITIVPEHGTTEKTIRLFVLGSCLGVILHQRNLFPIHGSVIDTPTGAVIVCGKPGIGKSTTAATLAKRGYRILSDDIAALKIDGKSIQVESSYPQLKLSGNSLNHINEDPERLEEIRPGIGKRAFKLQALFKAKPSQVTALAWLWRQQNTSPI
ncbi:hypothetical protein MLD52_14305 [Puniceicoccaceae bacterium K14]|nr:hypothetical protein [Puniceicoccaceae bacterium K14]